MSSRARVSGRVESQSVGRSTLSHSLSWLLLLFHPHLCLCLFSFPIPASPSILPFTSTPSTTPWPIMAGRAGGRSRLEAVPAVSPRLPPLLTILICGARLLAPLHRLELHYKSHGITQKRLHISARFTVNPGLRVYLGCFKFEIL